MNWQKLDAGGKSIEVVRNKNGALELFLIDSENRLWNCTKDGSNFSGWNDTGFGGKSVAAALNKNGQI